MRPTLTHSAHSKKPVLLSLSRSYELFYNYYMFYSPYTHSYLSVRVLYFVDPPSCQRHPQCRCVKFVTSLNHVNLDVSRFQILVRIQSSPPWWEKSWLLRQIKSTHNSASQKSWKWHPILPTREPIKSHPTANGTTEVISMDKGSPVWALTVYQASLDNVFDVHPRDDTFDRGPKPIKELVKLQLKSKTG